MRGYHVKVILLSLGVVLGFGSAIARHYHFRDGHSHHGPHGHWGHHDCWHDAPWASHESETQVDSKDPHDAARPADR